MLKQILPFWKKKEVIDYQMKPQSERIPRSSELSNALGYPKAIN